MFSNHCGTRKLGLILVCLSLLSACGNGEDADRIKEIIEINELNVTGLTISSPNTILEVGATEQFSASGIVAEGNKPAIDASNKVRWSSSDPSLARIDQSGKLTSLADGLVTVTARWADLSASKPIMLSSAELDSITLTDTVSPASVCTSNHQLSAQGVYADNTTRDITGIVSWSSADSSKLAFDQSGRFSTLGSGSVNVTATRDGIVGSKIITIADDLESISLSAPANEVSVNGSLAFTATGTYDGSGTRNLTTIATWQSNDTSKLTISNSTGSKGVAKGIAEGTANVSATCNSTSPVTSATRSITVTPEIVINGITINEDAANLEFKIIDSPVQLQARLKLSDDSFSTDVTDDDNTEWSIVRVVQGKGLTLNNTKGDKGKISFTETGVTRIDVRYNDNDEDIGPFTYEIEIEIVE